MPWHEKTPQNNSWHFPTVHASRARDKSKVLWLLVRRIPAITTIPAGNWEVELPEQTHSSCSKNSELGRFCPSRKENEAPSGISWEEIGIWSHHELDGACLTIKGHQGWRTKSKHNSLSCSIWSQILFFPSNICSGSGASAVSERMGKQESEAERSVPRELELHVLGDIFNELLWIAKSRKIWIKATLRNVLKCCRALSALSTQQTACSHFYLEEIQDWLMLIYFSKWNNLQKSRLHRSLRAQIINYKFYGFPVWFWWHSIINQAQPQQHWCWFRLGWGRNWNVKAQRRGCVLKWHIWGRELKFMFGNVTKYEIK